MLHIGWAGKVFLIQWHLGQPLKEMKDKPREYLEKRHNLKTGQKVPRPWKGNVLRVLKEQERGWYSSHPASKVQSGQRDSMVARSQEVVNIWTQCCSEYNKKVLESFKERRNKTILLFRGNSYWRVNLRGQGWKQRDHFVVTQQEIMII